MDKNNCDKPQFSGERVRLGELISKAKVARCGSADYPVLSMTMHDGIVEQSGRFKKAIASTDKSTYKVVNPGQLVVGFPIDEGVLYVQNCGYSGIMSPAYNVWNIDADKVLPSYLELALHSPQSMNYYASKIRGTTARRRSMPAETLCELPISLPGQERQRNIVATLTHLKSQQDNAECQLAFLDNLVKSRFNELFGKVVENDLHFPVIKLDDVCTSIVRGPFGSALKKEFFVPKGPGTYKVYEQKHAIQKRADIGIYYIDGERYESLNRFECHPGDILMSCSGTMGELYQLPPNCEPGVINQALCKFSLSDAIQVEYFLGCMNQIVDQLGAKGSGIKNVSSVKFIKAIEIPLPPITLQRDFATFSVQVDKLRFMLLGNPSPIFGHRSFCCSTNSGNGGVILEAKDYLAPAL